MRKSTMVVCVILVFAPFGFLAFGGPIVSLKGPFDEESKPLPIVAGRPFYVDVMVSCDQPLTFSAAQIVFGGFDERMEITSATVHRCLR